MRIFIRKLISKNKQFFKFGIVGLSNTLISYLTYAVLVYFSVHYQIANVVAFLVSSLNGFYLNRSWVFHAKQSAVMKQLLKYYIVYGSSLVLSLVLSYIWIEIFGINIYLAPILNLVITVPYNFILNKIWAFQSKKLENKKVVMEQHRNI